MNIIENLTKRPDYERRCDTFCQEVQELIGSGKAPIIGTAVNILKKEMGIELTEIEKEARDFATKMMNKSRTQDRIKRHKQHKFSEARRADEESAFRNVALVEIYCMEEDGIETMSDLLEKIDMKAVQYEGKRDRDFDKFVEESNALFDQELKEELGEELLPSIIVRYLFE